MRLAPIPAALALALSAAPAWGQIATDGSVGPRTTLTGPRFGISDSLGTRVGRNLIHSFQTFNVRNGESAVFGGQLPTDNIVARVTGGTSSLIDGLVRVEQAGASLFLVNPSGMMFGPGASIDVPGSFYASTAHTLKFADGNAIDMRTAAPVSLTAAPPSAFGFEGPGAAMALSGAQLRAREGQRLGFVAGDIAMRASDAGRISLASAPSGAVSLVATRGAGTVTIDGDALAPAGFAAMGDITIGGGSGLFVNEGAQRSGGGRITVRGGDVTLDHAQLESRSRFGNGRSIDVGATGRLAIDASNVLAITTGAGNAGSLRLEGRDIAVSGGSLVDTSCDPGCTTGSGGALTIVAGNGLTITGNNPQLPTFVVSNSFGGGTTGAISITTGGALTMAGTSYIQGIGLAGGSGSSITLRTGSIDLSGGAQVDASTRGTGQGGNIAVENRGEIRITGTRRDPTQGNLKLPSGFFVNTAGTGNAGSLVISTASLQVVNGGEISSTAQRGSTGEGGRIEIRASGLVRVAGTDTELSLDGKPIGGKSSGIVANTFSSGAAGEIDLAADRVEIVDEGAIQTQSEGSGRANTIRIEAREMTVANGGQVASAAFGTGDGGTVDIRVEGLLSIAGRSASGREAGIFASTSGPAAGGIVRLAIGDLLVERGGGVFSQSRSTGPAGDIDITAARTVTVRDLDDTGSGISAAATGVSVETARAGNVTIRAGETIRIENARPQFGAASTSARSLAGGNVSLSAGQLVYIDNSDVAAEVAGGFGSGGNVTIETPTLVLRGAEVTANAFGGPGGNIRFITQDFFPSANSTVTASSQLSVDGTITFDSPALDPTGELLAPVPVFLDAGAVLAGRCGPRLAGRASSLVFIPRPVEGGYPDELRPVLDGRATGFLTVPTPQQACSPAPAARLAQVAR